MYRIGHILRDHAVPWLVWLHYNSSIDIFELIQIWRGKYFMDRYLHCILWTFCNKAILKNIVWIQCTRKEFLILCCKADGASFWEKGNDFWQCPLSSIWSNKIFWQHREKFTIPCRWLLERKTSIHHLLRKVLYTNYQRVLDICKRLPCATCSLEDVFDYFQYILCCAHKKSKSSFWNN